jgi:predicted AlkP superfamily phosphohydrolase/phosphomutase
MTKVDKVAIIGLDCADPELLFNRWLPDLPNLHRLTEAGLHGTLESCIPPVTVPAWSCMASGKDPGTLGVYGFRNRRDWSYEDLGLATNLDIRQPRLWDYAARAGLPSITLGVPQTFPIVHPPRGCQVTCFLTPSTKSPYTYPPELAAEISGLVGEYMLDVDGFHTEDKHWLLGQVYRLAEQRFTVARHLLTTRPWNVFWMVEMGVDRIHHGFWQYMDPQHRRYRPGNPFEHAIRDYYGFVDRQIGTLLELLDLERTAIWIVSDHGAKRLDGGFCFNDWLIREGLLTMKTPAREKRRFSLADVDWTGTKAWGEGGYYGQCYINRAGREPLGLVPSDEYERFRDELIRRIEALPGPDGRALGNRAYKPESLYADLHGCPPDLIVLFGDLHWRSVGAVGNPGLYALESDTGPDDANHALAGLYVLSHPTLPPARRAATLYDVLPTTLQLLGLPAPRGLRGTSLLL